MKKRASKIVSAVMVSCMIAAGLPAAAFADMPAPPGGMPGDGGGEMPAGDSAPTQAAIYINADGEKADAESEYEAGKYSSYI